MGVETQLAGWAAVSYDLNVPPKYRGIFHLWLVKRVELGHLHMQCIGCINHVQKIVFPPSKS